MPWQQSIKQKVGWNKCRRTKLEDQKPPVINQEQAKLKENTEWGEICFKKENRNKRKFKTG